MNSTPSTTATTAPSASATTTSNNLLVVVVPLSSDGCRSGVILHQHALVPSGVVEGNQGSRHALCPRSLVETAPQLLQGFQLPGLGSQV